MDSQLIHGMRYLDENLGCERNEQGTMFAFHAANWNVTSTVNYGLQAPSWVAFRPLDRVHATRYGGSVANARTMNKELVP